MRHRSPFFAACCIAATALAVFLGGCQSSESRARAAYSDYQAASAAGDLRGMRKALLNLTKETDDNPAYWEELGRVQLELKNFNGAYYAYSRANELDSDNVATLSSLTQLALHAGNLEDAEEHAKNLELIAPNHPAARMAFGYIYLKREDFDNADAQADALLQLAPYEPGTKMLKARILLARGEPEQAIKLLEDQVRVQPDDAGSWKALMLLHERQNNWPAVANVADRLHQLDPNDEDTAITVIDASLRSNDIARARRASESLLQPNAPPSQVDAVLKLWADHWKSPDAIAEARTLARSAPIQHRLAYATYFNEVGSPDDAAALVGDSPQFPLNRTNLSINSVIATLLSLRGENAAAERVFDGILAREPDHVYALRGRINLEITTGKPKAAITDAQRLVSVMPNSARDRLLLARAYAAGGDARQVDRTLWDAFYEIPANFETYEALRVHLQRAGDTDGLERLDNEFKQQRDVDLAREFI